MNIIEKDEKDNRILGFEPQLINSSINFHGKNNRLICEKSVKLENSTLNFNGDNSIIYLSSNKNIYYLKIDIYNNSIFFMDENNFMNGILYLSVSEEKNIFIGNNCIISFGIWLRTADPHLIYNIEDKTRINFSKSIYIGDHVWIGQDVLILKGTQIGSGSILGAKTVISNKIVSSNTIWAGNPAKEIKKGIFFEGCSVHRYTRKETENSIINRNNNWIYTNDSETISFKEIEECLSESNDIDDRIEFILYLRNFNNKNRFFIG